jgi:hypothetical protein
MKLDQVLDDPLGALVYLERYVNLGSPSGFSASHSVSEHTSPLGAPTAFHLEQIELNADHVLHLGDQGLLDRYLPPGGMLLHPDVASRVRHRARITQFDGFTVSPTSSGRTVHALTKPAFHLKMHYDAVIGRMHRALTAREASYALYISRVICQGVRSGTLPSSFGILPEFGARVSGPGAPSGLPEIGLVIRDLEAVCPTGAPFALVPAFALFSPDVNTPSDDTLLVQLARRSTLPPSEFLLTRLLFPLVDSYFSLLIRTGLQGEFHAQNVLVGLDPDGGVAQVVLRDMESVDTDESLRDELGLECERPSSDLKVISRSQPNYQTKHSFMFDFKLGEYLARPLVDTLAKAGAVDSVEICGAVRDHVRNYLGSLPSDFFPNGHWYSFDKVPIDRSTPARPYIRNEDPEFRPSLS